MFQASGRRDRPLYGSPDMTDDMAIRLSADLEGPEAVAAITDVTGAERASLAERTRYDRRSRAACAARLRIARGTPLELQIAALGLTGGGIHVLHLSGGRRVGGGTVQVAAQDSATQAWHSDLSAISAVAFKLVTAYPPAPQACRAR